MLAVVALAVSVVSLVANVWVLRTVRRSYLETHEAYLAAVARAERDGVNLDGVL